jgi:ABC-type protease/lipase transport system fused ATPase/permease subunit
MRLFSLEQGIDRMSVKRSTKSSVLTEGFKAMMPAILATVFFSFFINLLVFVSPLYMLQVYDRVVRAGALFDQVVSGPVFNAIHRANLANPRGGHQQGLRDVDTVREFLTGPGLIALFDLPWVPIFVFACFLLHPWFGYIAIGGSLIIFFLTYLNEITTSKLLKLATSNSIQANAKAQSSLRNGEAQAVDAPTLRGHGVASDCQRSGWLSRGGDQVFPDVPPDPYFGPWSVPRHYRTDFSRRDDRCIHHCRPGFGPR